MSDTNDTTPVPPPPDEPTLIDLLERFVRAHERQALAMETIAATFKSADETLTHVVEVQYHGVK